MICQLWIIFFFCPFGILQYKFLSYREVLHVLSELSELSKLSELIELPEVFSSMKKCLLHGALRPGGPLLELLELRFVSSSSETSRSFGTTQTSQSSIDSHSVFPDVATHQTLQLLISQVIIFALGVLVALEGLLLLLQVFKLIALFPLMPTCSFQRSKVARLSGPKDDIASHHQSAMLLCWRVEV